MSITLTKVTVPLRGDIIDFCLEMQKKGVVVSIVKSDPFGIRIHPPEELPRATILKNLRLNVRDGIDEYTFLDESGVTCVVYDKKAAEAYHPPRILPINTMRLVRPTVTFYNKNFVKSFPHHPEEVITEEIII